MYLNNNRFVSYLTLHNARLPKKKKQINKVQPNVYPSAVARS